MKKFPNCRKRLENGRTRWVARLVFPCDPLTGQQLPPKDFSAPTAADADARRAEYMSRWKMNPKADTGATFAAYLRDEFIPHEERRTELPDASKRSLSYQKYKERASRLTKFASEPQARVLCNTPLADLEPEQFRRYLEWKEARVSSPLFNKLRQDLKLALKGLLGRTRLPVSEFYLYFPPPSEERPKPKSLYDPNSLLDKIEDPKYPVFYRALIAFEFVVNCRPQEMFALQWSDIDWESGKVTIDKRLCVVKGAGDRKFASEVKAHTKIGPKGNRTVYLGSLLAPLLRDLQRQRLASGSISPYVFCGADGGMLNKMRLRRLWVKVREELELGEGQFYWLKTLGNSYAQENGVSPTAQAAKMGHQSTKMSTTAYRTVSESELLGSVEVFTRRKPVL